MVWVLCFGLALAQPGWVNPYTGGVWNNPGSCLLDTMIRNRMNQQMLEKSLRREVKTHVAQPLTYRAVESRANAAQLAASLTDNAQERRELTESFVEALRTYRVAAAQAGRPNDLGHALAFCLACCYSAAHACDVPDADLLALARQMDVALGNMAGLRETTDAQRQMVADQLVMVGTFVAAGAEQSRQKPEARAAFAELARGCFRSLTGLDVENVQLSGSGLRLK